jgi:hypothetical protein
MRAATVVRAMPDLDDAGRSSLARLSANLGSSRSLDRYERLLGLV